MPKFVQKATLALACRSFLSRKLCCTRYFWNPASANMSAKLTTMVTVATMPNASGASSLAKTSCEIGEMILAIISVARDHFAALADLARRSFVSDILNLHEETPERAYWLIIHAHALNAAFVCHHSSFSRWGKETICPNVLSASAGLKGVNPPHG